MWLVSMHSLPTVAAGGSEGPLPTTPIALIGYIAGILILVGLPLLVQSRRRDEDRTPEPPPQLVTAATHQVADASADKLERAWLANFETQKSENQRLVAQVARLESELHLEREASDRKDEIIGKLRRRVDALEAARDE